MPGHLVGVRTLLLHIAFPTSCCQDPCLASSYHVVCMGLRVLGLDSQNYSLRDALFPPTEAVKLEGCGVAGTSCHLLMM